MRRVLPAVFLSAMGGCAQDGPAPVPAPATDARDRERVAAASLELLWGAEWDHPSLARLGAPGKWFSVAFSGDGERLAVVRPRGPGAARMIAVVPTATGPEDDKGTIVEAATADYVTMGSGSSVLVYDAKLWPFDLKSRALGEVLAVPDEEFLAARPDARFALTFNRTYKCYLRDLSAPDKQFRIEGSPGRVAWDPRHDRVAIATMLFIAGGGTEGEHLRVHEADGKRLHRRAIDRTVNALDFDLEPADGVGPDTILAAALSAPRDQLVVVSLRGLRLYRIRN